MCLAQRKKWIVCKKNCWNMYSKIQFIWLIGAFSIPPSNSFCTSCEWNPSESSIEHIVQCGSVGPGWHGVYTASALHTLQCLSLAWYCRFATIPRPFALREVNSEFPHTAPITVLPLITSVNSPETVVCLWFPIGRCFYEKSHLKKLFICSHFASFCFSGFVVNLGNAGCPCR